MNHPLACPRTRSLEGGGYLTLPSKSSLTVIIPKDGLWKLTDPTGLWTHFEGALRGTSPQPLGKPSVSHRSLDALRSSPRRTRAHKLPQAHASWRVELKGEIDCDDTQTLALPSAARNIVT